MSFLICKMCGGDLEILENSAIAECVHCRRKQTIPSQADENLQNLFNRANTLRMKGEFDKAEQIYESLIRTDGTQAEAYWGLILCKYGIEYVDDPATGKKIPTCHRASYDSIIADDDYKSALENAHFGQKWLYEEQAKEIDRIQKEILALAQKEETYDIFICYKETDENGRKTQDSVYANDIYYQLKQNGYKVFYSAITLEGKLGREYEPIIFAALNSAKVMLVIGTKNEYFKAVWVKNEWSRFLKIIKKDRSKLLIPCYRDMDAYDLPDEFLHLQAQNMSKIGFMQDLIRGIKKIVSKDEPKTSTVVKETVVQSASINVAPLLKRAFMFLEDGDWKSADEYCEKVLDQDPENAQAYLGKLMVELKVKKQDDLKNCSQPFDNNLNYRKVMRYGDENLKKLLQDDIDYIKARNEKARQEQEKLKREAKEKQERLKREAEEKARKMEEEKSRCKALFEEYKTVTKNEREYARKKSEANLKLSSLNNEYTYLVNFKNNWQNIENELNSLNEKVKMTQTDISSLQAERSNLGFFAMKRKKEIDEKISALNAEQQSLKGFVLTVEKKKRGYSNATEVDNKINSVLCEIDEQKKLIEKINVSRTSQTVREELSKFDLGKKLLNYANLDFDSAWRWINVKKGDFIKFGSYEQDNNTSNGKEPIEWKVLDVKDGKALLISKYALDSKPYNISGTDVTWERCSLRKWLNNDFFIFAFSADEKAKISMVTLSAEKNSQYSTKFSDSTQDRVFLLNKLEFKKYFTSDNERLCKATRYAVANDTFVFKGLCEWWLRSLGANSTCADIVTTFGGVAENRVRDAHAIRPALWINLES